MSDAETIGTAALHAVADALKEATCLVMDERERKGVSLDENPFDVMRDIANSIINEFERADAVVRAPKRTLS